MLANIYLENNYGIVWEFWTLLTSLASCVIPARDVAFKILAAVKLSKLPTPKEFYPQLFMKPFPSSTPLFGFC